MEAKPLISVVIGSYNRQRFLKLTIESIRKELESLKNEIIVVDGGSTDGTIKWLTNQKDIISIIQHNRGVWKGKKVERRSWGYFMNLGFKCAQGKYVCMLSDDCLVIPGAIINGFNLFEEKLREGQKIGALAFYWRNWPEQKKYWIGLTLGDRIFVNHGMYLKEALEDVGYIDEESFLFYHADGDLCLKMWFKGYNVIESPNSYIEHYSHANMALRQSNLENQKSDWENYLNKWERIYYDKQENNFGSWIEKEFTDIKNTTHKYWHNNLIDYLRIPINTQLCSSKSKHEAISTQRDKFSLIYQFIFNKFR
jgi:glycosyltransferase involved in cell wall biosynthesis